jgi:autotransporter-associated beta strand protein
MQSVKRRAVLSAAVAVTMCGLIPELGLAQLDPGTDRRGPALKGGSGWNSTLPQSPSHSRPPQQFGRFNRLPVSGVRAQTAFWRGDFFDSWSVPTNWSTGVVPNATTDTAAFDALSNGRAVILDLNVNLSSIDASDPQSTSFLTSTDDQGNELGSIITLNGPATVNAANQAPDVPDFVFGAGGFVNPGFEVGAVVAGSAGLTKTGNGNIYLSRDNTYTGNTVVNGGRLTIETDASLGNSAGSLALNNNSILQVFGSFQTSRNISIGTGGARIELLGPMNSSGNISGSTPLSFEGPFVSSVATFTTANSYTGVLTLNAATTTFSGSGGFPNASQVNVQSILQLNGSGDRLPNAGTVDLGGGLTINSGDEQVGALRLRGGFSLVRTTSNATLTAGSLDRGANRGGVKFQIPNLSTSSKVIFTTPPTMIDGLIPGAWANPVNFDVPQSPNNTLVTYDAVNGVVPLAAGSYSSSFAGANATTNVRIDVDTPQAAAVTVNSLVLAPPTSNMVGIDIGTQAGPNGLITVDTGIVLNGHAGASSSDGINFIWNPMAFGAREAIFICPSALRMLGAISGTGGLTKLGGEAMLFQGASTYTGTTNLAGFNVLFDNVLADGVTPGPFGRSTTPININCTGLTEFNIVSGQFEGSAAGQLILGVVGARSFNRDLNFQGAGQGLMYSFATGAWSINGAVNINSGITLTFFGSASGASSIIFNGNITGAGALSTGDDAPVLTLNGTNTFSKLELVSGEVTLGNNSAMGAGQVHVMGPTTIIPVGGRTFANDVIVHSDSTLTIGGTGASTFNGVMDLDNLVTVIGPDAFFGFTVPINVTSSGLTTFAGRVTRGGMEKLGAGQLVLSGNNDFAGPLVVGDGTNTGGTVVLRHNNAAGLTTGATIVNENSTVALENNITIPDGEDVLFSGSGDLGLGALRNLSGNNTWGGSAIGFGSLTNVVRADSGTLTIKGALATQDLNDDPNTPPPPLTNLPLTKSGTGVINVGSADFNDGSTTFKGAIILDTGTLTVSQGTLRVSPTTPANAVISSAGAISIAGGPVAPTAKLDLTNTSMVVEYGANPSPLQAIRQLIRAGFNNGNWAGNGITSSRAATSPNAGEAGKTALGYAELALIPAGQVGDTAVLIKYTYGGDSNLDGQVDVADLGALATAWQTAGTWINGDFDYNNTIDVNDLGILATNWQAGVGNPLGPGSLDEALAQLGLPNVAVPEPVSLGVIAVAAGMLRRRRTTHV